MKFISSGHCSAPGPNYDPGAPGINGRWEANETVLLRDAVISEINKRGYTDIVHDLNEESLNNYLHRVKPGESSIVIEFHFNAGPPVATGTEALVSIDADTLDKAFAAELALSTSLILDIPNRGVKSEATTRHKRLALMRKPGIVTLVETCFITNPADMASYDKNFQTLVRSYADLIIKYDSLIS